MLDFKGSLADDLNNVFFNEFGEQVDIEGKKITVVIDTNELKEMQLKNGGQGLANSEVLFHVKKSDLDFTPFTGQDLMFNNKLYYVNDVKEDEGVYIITLGVAR